jgi:hypothetical protein
MNIAARDGAFIVNTWSFGKKFTVDPSKLRFTLRSQDRADAKAMPFDARVGSPVRDRSFDQAQPPGTLTSYDLPVVFPKRPAPGMYDLAVLPQPGFTRNDDGTELPPGERSAHTDVYWPDEDGADVGLSSVRARLVNRTVYGLGGIVLSCGAASFKTYLASVGVTVRSVERRHGVLQRLWTGSMVNWGNDAAYSFLSVDPLELRAEYPKAAPFGTGGSTEPAGDAPCPGLTLADPWHVDVTITSTPPPPLPSGYDQFKIAIGMSRADVARRRGYPQGYFTRAALDAQPEWAYEDALVDAYTITFRNGRVASFTVPRGLP